MFELYSVIEIRIKQESSAIRPFQQNERGIVQLFLVVQITLIEGT
jgi:hypothetical protein